MDGRVGPPGLPAAPSVSSTEEELALIPNLSRAVNTARASISRAATARMASAKVRKKILTP